MTDKQKRTRKWILPVIIPIIIAVILCAAILITNIFIPIKYLTAYCVRARENKEGQMRVTFIDVGFGDSSLVEFPDGKIMLIDGGDGSYPHELALIKYLNWRGVDDIDFLVCTSVKDEHCGGLAEIVKYKNVKKAYIPYCINTRLTEEYDSFVSALSAKGVDCVYACKGEGYADENYDLFFTFISPTSWNNPQSEYAQMNSSPTAENIDNASAVLWLEYCGTAFAFTSDVGRTSLQTIVQSYALCGQLGEPFCPYGGHSVRLENCKVTAVPAHGAAANSYKEWYGAVTPDYAVVSVGDNFAGLPSDSALADVYAFCEPVFTGDSGDIVFTVDKDGIIG